MSLRLNKMILMFMAAIMLLSLFSLNSMTAHAAYVEGDIWIGTDGQQMTAAEANRWTYQQDGDGIFLTSYTGSIVNGKIVGCVPASINGVPVTNMYGTFRDIMDLVEAPVIPNTVTDMTDTFNGCSSLTEAPVIPSSVTTMANTFMFCESLTTAPVIPDSVTSLDCTFYYCSSLTKAPEIPSSVTNMNSTFFYCTSLEEASTIPDSVTNMTATFYSCTSLKEAPAIPNSVTQITSCFADCQQIYGETTIPEALKVDETIFKHCKATVSGQVTDGSGNGVANVSIVATDADGNELTGTTDSNGNYSITGFEQVGDYDIKATINSLSASKSISLVRYENGIANLSLSESGTGSTGDTDEQDPDPTPGTDPDPDPAPGTTTNGTVDGNMSIYGTVEPIIIIDITLPVNGLQFTINADRTISWIDTEVISNSPAPLNVSIIYADKATLAAEEVGVYNIDGAPSLVEDNRFSDWNNLSRAESKANIAISVNGENISSASTTNPIEIGNILSAYGEDTDGNFQANPQTLDINGSAFYGKAWDNSEDLLFKYDTVLAFAMT